MSWANELYAVYEKALIITSNPMTSEKDPLLPISHSTAKAQLEVTISSKGEFLDAIPIADEKDALTIIPVTEDSGARSSGIYPHPFSDKLVYIAGDYCEYCSAKKGDEEKFNAYILQLKKWRDSDHSHPSVNALYDYLSKGTLIGDLVRARALKIGDNGKLTAEKIQKTIDQSDCFVRFIVSGSPKENTWLDTSLYEKFIEYNRSVQPEKALCYATGEVTFCTYKHPSKILNEGDKGKLFSANDESGFSFRGRFLDKKQAVSIGYEFSQKMHNGLKWLRKRQGIPIGSLTLIVWDSELDDLPNICGSSQDLSEDDLDDMPEIFSSYRETLRKCIFGTKEKPTIDQKTMILVLDEATTGRVSVNMYSELPKSEFLENIYKWHSDTAWNRYDFNKKKDCPGSFALPQIAEFAYGTEQNGKVVCKQEMKNDTVLRLIPCVTDGRKIPSDILRQLVNRTLRRSAYDRTWNTLLGITCGMIRKKMIEEGNEVSMALDRNCDDRSYLFGRFLAWAEIAERTTFKKGEEHQTNSERYFEKFASRPAATMEIIEKRLKPYLNRMTPGQRKFYDTEHDEILGKLTLNNFISDSKLDPQYLLGYSHERSEIRSHGGNKNNDNSEEV